MHIKILMTTLRKAILLTLAFTASTITLVSTVNRLVPNPDGSLGHDYSYYLPYLLTGAQWVHQNGWLTIPYFTPDYCGGVPWLPNPQSMFYSVPQFLTVILGNPVSAVNLTLIVFATVGGVATYLLLQKCFGASWQASALVFVLFQLNGFLLFRVAIGHLTYHIFGLIPVLCCLLLLPATAESVFAQIKSTCATIAGGVVLAIMVYGGALNFIIPAVLSVMAVLFIQQVRTGWRLTPWCMLAGACFWAIPLSAIKLLPAFVFTHGYARPYIPSYLFDDPARLLKVLAASLFTPEVLPTGISPIQGSFNALGLHEFEFGVSIVPLLLILAAVPLLVRKLSSPRHLFAWVGLALLVAIPIVLSVGNEAWGRTLLKIPIINNNTTFVRWWSIYIMPLIIAAGLSFDRVLRGAAVRDVALSAGVLVVVAQLISRDLGYYQNNMTEGLYDPSQVTRAVGRVSSGMPLSEISHVGPSPNHQPKLYLNDGMANDGLIWGISTYPCYEPLFGYSLELFPAHELHAGPVKSEIDDRFNLADPRCYLSPDLGLCAPGALFLADQRLDVAKFTSHRPLPWLRPLWQDLAEYATTLAGSLSVLGLLVLAIGAAGRFQPSVKKAALLKPSTLDRRGDNLQQEEPK
jgi:hypothetical protein